MDVVNHRCMVNMPVYSMQLDIDNEQLIEDIQQHRKNFPEGEVSNVKAWRSSYKTHHINKNFDPFIEKILEAVDHVRKFDLQNFCQFFGYDFLLRF